MTEKNDAYSRAAAHLRAVRERRYATSAAAARAAGLKPRTYWDLEQGNRKINEDYASLFANIFGGQMEQYLPVGATPTKAGRPPKKQLPHVDFNPNPQLALAKLIKAAPESALDKLGCIGPCYTMTNPDRAMTPNFLPGDILGFDAGSRPAPGDFVLVRIKGEAPVFRIFYPASPRGAVFKSVNPDIASMRVSSSRDWENLGRLVFVWRSLSSFG